MNFKNIFLIIAILGVFFWYTMVYSSFYKDLNINFLGLSSKNIYLNSEKLNNSIIAFSSKDDISNYIFHSPCNIKTEFLYTVNAKYFFNLEILEKNCSQENFYLKNEKGDILTNTHFKLNLIGDFDLYNKLTDYNNELLSQANKKYLTLKDKFKLFASIDDKNLNFDFVKKSRYYDELDYNNSKIEEIIIKRQNKYQIPVEGYSLPDGKNPSKLPNSARPYRASYTNAVHEGWDIDAPSGKEVVSIDDGIIVKVINDFQFEDLNNLKKDGNLSYEDKVKNLDILRGNQVWVKTMKGDVIFYSHLSEVYQNIQIGQIVEKGQPLGKIGISGVPDKNYSDYHLHFELRKNPYLKTNAGNNTEFDYMNWDWYFKGQSREYILKNQYTIFQN